MVINISNYSIFRNLPASSGINNDPDDSAVPSRSRAEEGAYFRPENYQMLTDLIRDMKEAEKENYLADTCVPDADLTEAMKNKYKTKCPLSPTNSTLPPPKVEGIIPSWVQKKIQPDGQAIEIHGDNFPEMDKIESIELSDKDGNKIAIKNRWRKPGWQWRQTITLLLNVDPTTVKGTYNVKIFGKDKRVMAEKKEALRVLDVPSTPFVHHEEIIADNEQKEVIIGGANIDNATTVQVVDPKNDKVVFYNTTDISPPKIGEKIRKVQLKLNPDDLKEKGLDVKNEGLKKKYSVSLIVSYSDGAKTVLPFAAIDARQPPPPPPPPVPVCQAPSVCMVPPQPLGRTIITRELETDNTEHNIMIVGPDLDKVAKVRIMVQKDGEDKEIYPVDIKIGMLSDQNRILAVPVTIDPQKLKNLGLQGYSAKTPGRTNYDAIIVILDKDGSEIDRQKINLYQDSIPQTFAPWIEKGLAPQSEVGAVVNSEAGRVPIGLGFVPQVFGATDRAMVKTSWLEWNLEARGSLFLGEEYKEVPNGARLGGNVIIKPFKWLGIEAQGNYTWSGSGSTMNLPYFYRMKSQTGKFVGALHFEVPKAIKFKFNAEYTGTGYSNTNGVETADNRWRGTAALLLDMTKFTDSVWAPSRISANGGFVFYGARKADGQEDKLRGGGFMSHLRWDKGIFSECPIEPYFGIELEKSSSTRNWNPHLGVNFNIMDFLRNTLGKRHEDILPPQGDY